MKKYMLKDRVLVLFCYIFVGAFAVFCFAPFWLALISSITDENSLFRDGFQLFPNKFSFTAYKMIFSTSATIYRAYGVTIISTVFGVLLTLVLTGSFSYVCSVKNLRYKNKLTLFAYFTMLFNGGLVPTYILYTKYLHLSNNILVLIIPGALTAYNMFLMRNYFMTIPDSICESARIDGANDIYIFFKIIIPVSKPVFATIGLFAAMTYWNEWFRVLMYIDNPKLYSLQYLIMRIQREVDFLTSSLGSQVNVGQVPAIGIRMATAMITIGPIILLYPGLQKYFIKGLMVGAVKG